MLLNRIRVLLRINLGGYMRILVACEESGRVTKAFRDRGFDAWSCDILPTSGPDWQHHYIGDLFNVFYNYGPWDVVIAFPPCTFLTVANPHNFRGNRRLEGLAALDFVSRIYNLPVKHLVIENPVGYLSRYFRKPDQVIQPYMFGDPFSKKTCLWLRGLPCLESTVEWKFGVYPSWVFSSGVNGKARERSKTFPGIASAMAQQWGDYLSGVSDYGFQYLLL